MGRYTYDWIAIPVKNGGNASVEAARAGEVCEISDQSVGIVHSFANSIREISENVSMLSE